METKQEILNKTFDYIKLKFQGEGSGHDWWHIYRVLRMAEKIGNEEKADLYIVQLAALLHDIADHKFHNGDHTIGAKVANEWLIGLNASSETILKVTQIIDEISFKGAGVPTPMSTLEGKIVQDADRLDAIGAIGIARTFAYGGNKNRALFEPDEKVEMHESFEAYKNGRGHTINHFYEKLLLLKDLMNTQTGKRLAKDRHQFMVAFLKQFYKEWDGEY